MTSRWNNKTVRTSGQWMQELELRQDNGKPTRRQRETQWKNLRQKRLDWKYAVVWRVNFVFHLIPSLSRSVSLSLSLSLSACLRRSCSPCPAFVKIDKRCPWIWSRIEAGSTWGNTNVCYQTQICSNRKMLSKPGLLLYNHLHSACSVSIDLSSASAPDSFPPLEEVVCVQTVAGWRIVPCTWESRNRRAAH